MTLLYDAKPVEPHPIEPIFWTATRLVLIVSHQGVGHHQWVETWPLAG